MQGLSHPHVDDIGDARLGLHRAAHRHDLLDNLVMVEISRQSQAAGQTKCAGHGATDLRGNAQGLPVVVRNQDALDAFPVSQLE